MSIAALANLTLALLALVLLAADTPANACDSSAGTPLHSGWLVPVAFIGSIATWLVALGFRLALPRERGDLRGLLGRVQWLCTAGFAMSVIAGYVLFSAYACFE